MTGAGSLAEQHAEQVADSKARHSNAEVEALRSAWDAELERSARLHLLREAWRFGQRRYGLVSPAQSDRGDRLVLYRWSLGLRMMLAQQRVLFLKLKERFERPPSEQHAGAAADPAKGLDSGALERVIEDLKRPGRAHHRTFCDLAFDVATERLVDGRPPPVGWWPVQVERGRHWSPLPGEACGFADMAMIWPCLTHNGAFPVAWDLVAIPFDGVPRSLVGTADLLVWQGTAMSVIEERELFDLLWSGRRVRLRRDMKAWLTAVATAHDPEEGGPEEALPDRGPRGDAHYGEEAPPLEAFILDPRGPLSRALLEHAETLLCDDIEHSELVSRWRAKVVPPQRKPKILVPAGEGAAA